ncbi:MAG: DUF4982 domain-containing protein [Bacteroidaceae bacterium]|nr:DUF4982 domain-containing protein [Bacteroidaceae bacterium]
MTKRTLLTIFVATMTAMNVNAQGRTETILTDGWQFFAAQSGEAEHSQNKQQWTSVTVPHDWAIAGPFDKKWDMQTVAIVQNGETEASEKTGRSGALPWIGKGFYKRSFSIPEGFNGHAELLFDGAMAEAHVIVNGKEAGYWAYGYNAFRVDITDFVKPGENTLEVNLQNKEESSRWYPGAGIYRPVTLITTGKTHLDDWSLVARTIEINDKKNTLMVEVDGKVMNVPPKTKPNVVTMAKVTMTTPDGETVNSDDVPLAADGSFHTSFVFKNPKLWSPETPYLYTVTATVNRVDWNGPEEVYDGQSYYLLDSKAIKTGLRTVRVSREHGFQLNGVTRKIKGVCLHHDLGPLGAAVNKAALIRQIKILKEMGCDAIRTSHNMPSQMQMDICDSLGMMVMAESFDMWIYPKCKNGYARFFHEWADKDITNLVLAHRNHPSIVMWSIGNEIPEQWSEKGRQIAIRLRGICHSLDPTRPVTQGCDRVDNALASGFMQAMDVPGLNYRLNRYQKAYETVPHGFLLGSETASTVSSRGVYHFPVVEEAVDQPKSNLQTKHHDGQCSGYDVNYCSWSNLPDDDWRWQDDYPWVIGEFVWTGFDYLGEPTPYDGYWPSRSSYFGICDLAGLPKDRYYLYRSHWNKDKHTIHLLPHWTWGKERRGEATPVYCYTDYPSAELFLNGKSLGKRTKVKANEAPSGAVEGAITPHHLDRYRLRWNEVKYEPGELRVVVYDEDGKPAGEKVVRTAGKPANLQLDVWTQHDTPSLRADGDDLAFITVSLTDKEGTLVPDADDQLTFDITGAGSFEAVCNGDATSLESFKQPTMRLFHGQLVVIVRSSHEAGTLTLKVRDAQRKLTKSVTLSVSPQQ